MLSWKAKHWTSGKRSTVRATPKRIHRVKMGWGLAMPTRATNTRVRSSRGKKVGIVVSPIEIEPKGKIVEAKHARQAQGH